MRSDVLVAREHPPGVGTPNEKYIEGERTVFVITFDINILCLLEEAEVEFQTHYVFPVLCHYSYYNKWIGVYLYFMPENSETLIYNQVCE